MKKYNFLIYYCKQNTYYKKNIMTDPVSITSNELASVIHKIIIDKFHEANKMGYLDKDNMDEMFNRLGLIVCKNKSDKSENCDKSNIKCKNNCCKTGPITIRDTFENKPNNIKIISYKKIPKKPSVNLPFCNVIVKEWCYGIKVNHGLYTQCHLKKVKDGVYCKTCLKQSKKNKNKLPNSGDIRNRKFNVKYVAPNKKKQKPYSVIVKKQNIDIKFAIREANKLNWTIPEEDLKNIKPVKVSSVVSDTSDEEDVEIIDSKIKKASKEFENCEEKKEDPDTDSDTDSDTESDTDNHDNDSKFRNFEIKIIKGNKYYFDKEGESNIKDDDGNIIKNMLLDYDEGIPVGTFNENKIMPLNV